MTVTKISRRRNTLTKARVILDPQLLQNRLVLVWIFFCLCALGLIARLIFLQTYQADELISRARQQQVRIIQTFSPRRTITDRHGMILAVDQAVYAVYAHPPLLKRPPQEVAQAIAPLLNQSPAELTRKLSQPSTSIRLEQWLSEESAQALKKLFIQGIDLVPQQRRIYPHQQLAAEIIGFVDIDHIGQAGLEKSQEAALKQPQNSLAVFQDGNGDLKPYEVPLATKAPMRLTIDARLQRRARELLQQQMAKFSAKRGTALVMDSHTGELLALVTQPTYDPNRFFDYYKQPELFANWAVSDLYEPGSTFKTLNVAIALDAGTISPDTYIYDPGIMQIGDAIVKNFDGGGGNLSVTEILESSSNIGMVKMMAMMPRANYFEWLQRIGIDQKTGTDLPAEAIGQLKPREEFLNIPIESAAAAFGQGLSLSPLKMLQLQGILANGGQKVTPHVVQGWVDETGKLHAPPRPQPTRIFKQTTANYLVQMMTGVVENGTGKSARIQGYRYGGKTGTAQKANPTGGYSDAKITSYVGIFPAQAPRYVVLAVIDEPIGEDALGSSVSAPVVKGILEELITIEGIPPSHPQEINNKPNDP